MEFKNWLISVIQKKFKDYKDIKANIGERRFDYKGFYPDIILASHGITVALVQVETEESLKDIDRPKVWKDLASLGPRLILMVPAEWKSRVSEMIWQEGLINKVSIGTYELVVKL